ncbi:g9920 [Coccomyxa viridis]|uniref:G9920 protein n=1 Tax=Coccomyxa viridis TaxID=1274662 RepID=A0ABP1G490_9CHLO
MEDYFEGSTAIVGAGFAGLAAANRLASKGVAVTVYDMGSRGPGGRASFREVPLKDGGFMQFDHGCQFIMASNPLVAVQIREWELKRFLREWTGRFGLLDASTGIYTDRTAMHAPQRPSGTTSQGPKSLKKRLSGVLGLLKKGSGKSAAPELSKGGAEGEGHTDGQTGQLGVCGILGQGRVYVGSSCMVDACSAMYQQIGIQVKWGEQASSVTGHCFHMLGVKQATHHSESGWELTVETRRKDKYTRQHRNLILADQMNVRPGSHGYVNLGEHDSCVLSQRVQTVKRCPRYSLMIAIKRGVIQAPFDGATIANSEVIEWLSNDSSKPGRERDDDLECWVAVATEAYARSLIAEMPLFKKDGQYVPQTDAVLSDIANRIWDAVKGLLKPFSEGEVPQPVYLRAQRWASAYKAELIEEPCVTDLSLDLGACGDFCGKSSTAEGAILSGLAAADSIAAHALEQAKAMQAKSTATNGMPSPFDRAIMPSAR